MLYVIISFIIFLAIVKYLLYREEKIEQLTSENLENMFRGGNLTSETAKFILKSLSNPTSLERECSVGSVLNRKYKYQIQEDIEKNFVDSDSLIPYIWSSEEIVLEEEEKNYIDVELLGYKVLTNLHIIEFFKTYRIKVKENEEAVLVYNSNVYTRNISTLEFLQNHGVGAWKYICDDVEKVIRSL